MIGDTSEHVNINIVRDWWVRRNNRVDCMGNYCPFWRLEWVRAYQCPELPLASGECEWTLATQPLSSVSFRLWWYVGFRTRGFCDAGWRGQRQWWDRKGCWYLSWMQSSWMNGWQVGGDPYTFFWVNPCIFCKCVTRLGMTTSGWDSDVEDTRQLLELKWLNYLSSDIFGLE